MKKSRWLSASVAAVTVAAGIGFAPVASAEVTDADKVTMQKMREEERMARDLYQHFSNKYNGARPFSNIVNSEQNHFDMMGALLARNGVQDPSAGLNPGTYAMPEIQALYDNWLQQGNASINSAFQVGVDLETADIADLEDAIAATNDADAKTTYERLLAASRNHLQAFQRKAGSGSTGGSGDSTGDSGGSTGGWGGGGYRHRWGWR